jgi:nucleoid DNA-binding protein
MKTQIPFESDRVKHGCLVDAVRYASVRSGLPVHDVVRVLNAFFDDTMQHVISERAVWVPGFGTFAAAPDYKSPRAVARPALIADGAFRAETQKQAKTDNVLLKQIISERRRKSRTTAMRYRVTDKK